MTRRLLIIALFLLAGAVANVAVAWGCAAFSERPEVWQKLPDAWQSDSWHGPSPARQGLVWHVSTLKQPGAYRVIAASVKPRRPGWIVEGGPPRRATRLLNDPADELPDRVQSVVADEIGSPEGSNRTVVIDARGWPLRALYVVGYPPEQVISGGLPLPTKRLQSWWISAFALPCRPIWPGFPINTIFYAALVWVLICGPFALRRFWRVEQGFCPKCAYPMGESSVCTECGCELPERASTA